MLYQKEKTGLLRIGILPLTMKTFIFKNKNKLEKNLVPKYENMVLQ